MNETRKLAAILAADVTAIRGWQARRRSVRSHAGAMMLARRTAGRLIASPESRAQ